MPARGAIRRRRKADDEDAPADETAQPVAVPPAKKAKPKQGSSGGGAALSFDLEDEGEAFQVSKKKKKLARLEIPSRDGDNDAELAGASRTGAYTAEMLAKLRASQQFRAAPSGKDDGEPLAGDVLPGEAEGAGGDAVPDAEAIRIARARRERARREGKEIEEDAAADSQTER